MLCAVLESEQIIYNYEIFGLDGKKQNKNESVAKGIYWIKMNDKCEKIVVR